MENREIDLLSLLRYLLRKIYLPILLGIVLAAAAFCISKFMIDPTYRATTRLYILNQSHEDYIVNSDLQSASQIAADCEVLIAGRNVRQEVVRRLDLSSEDTDNTVFEVTMVENTRILQVTVTDTEPERAARIANCVAEVASEQIVEIVGVKSVNVIYPASVPLNPSSPSVGRNTFMGGAIGILLALAVLLICFVMDEKIRTEDDVTRYLGLNTIGVIPFTGKMPEKKRRR